MPTVLYGVLVAAAHAMTIAPCPLSTGPASKYATMKDGNKDWANVARRVYGTGVVKDGEKRGGNQKQLSGGDPDLPCAKHEDG